MTELELKFHVLPAQRGGLLKALGNRKLERIRLLARYVDTCDGLLARHGFSLRLRRGGVRWMQTLKGRGPGSFERLEHNVDLGESPAGGVACVVDPARHRGTPVGDLLASLLKEQGDPLLVEVYVTDVARIRRVVHSHNATVEWGLDEGWLQAGDERRPISELELEFKGGDRAGLHAMALDWQGRHGLWLDTLSKSQRGQLLVAGRDCWPAVRAAPPRWNRRSAKALDGQGLLRLLVSACLSQILPNACEIAHGSFDNEHVHQLRVGLRRLRSALREMAPYAAALNPGWEAPVVRVFAELGAARDQQVFHSSLAPKLKAAGAPIWEFARHRSDVNEETLGALVRAAPFQAALLQLVAFADGAGSVPSEGDGLPLRQLRTRLTHLQRQVVRDVGQFETLAFDEQHRVRKRLKRLRYMAAFLAPLYRSRDVDAWLESVKPAQEALGKHIDLLTSSRRFVADAASEPAAWFAVGWISRETQESARQSRKCLERLARAEGFW